MKRLSVFRIGIAIALMTGALMAADEMDPEIKAALDEAKKATDGAKTQQMPNVNKMIEDAKKQAEKDSDPDTDATPTPAPATKPQPLKALPDWIPAAQGFKQSPGATHWTEAGMEKGRMTGVIAGAPKETAKAYADMVRALNKWNVTVNDTTINGALTMTVFVTYREGVERNLEFSLKPSPDGKTSLATFEYSSALPKAKSPLE